MPPPMHIVTTTSFAPRRLPSISPWPTRRGPDKPYGWPDALARGRRQLLHLLRAGVLVDHLHIGRDRPALVLELARGARLRRLLLAVHAVTVLRLAADAVALRDGLGGGEHRPVDRRLVLL